MSEKGSARIFFGLLLILVIGSFIYFLVNEYPITSNWETFQLLERGIENNQYYVRSIKGERINCTRDVYLRFIAAGTYTCKVSPKLKDSEYRYIYEVKKVNLLSNIQW
jgi:hypothetical protein